MLQPLRHCPRKPHRGRRRKRKRLPLPPPRKRLNQMKLWRDVCNWKSSADMVKPARTQQLASSKLARVRIVVRVTPRNRGLPRRLCRCQKDSKDRPRPEGIHQRRNLDLTKIVLRHHRRLVRHHLVHHRLVRPHGRWRHQYPPDRLPEDLP